MMRERSERGVARVRPPQRCEIPVEALSDDGEDGGRGLLERACPHELGAQLILPAEALLRAIPCGDVANTSGHAQRPAVLVPICATLRRADPVDV